jgi:Inhibitor of vertebrate lysozyme (Ivy)
MNVVARFSVVVVLGLACAACSHDRSAAQTPPASAAPTAPPASAIPMSAPASAAAVTPPVAGPALSLLMRRPGFASAFSAMDGAASLPAWTKQGGDDSTPSERVQVDGKTMLLAHACDPADCGSGRLLLLIDTQSRAMQGVFVEDSGSAGASVQQIIWLGKPDAATQAFLKDHLTQH